MPQQPPKVPMLAQAAQRLIEEFIALWNAGELTAACEVYAPEACLIIPLGLFQGRGKILEHYRGSFPDRTSMGNIKMRLIELIELGTDVGSAIVRWELSTARGTVESGHALEIYVRREGRVFILQDATVPDLQP